MKKKQELVVTDVYAKEGQDAAQIIQSSFHVFLKKSFAALQTSQIVSYNTHDEWPLISGGMVCT